MDLQVIIINQFIATVAFIQEVINSLSQRIDSQQGRQSPIQDKVLYDSLPHPLLILGQPMPQASPIVLHGQSEVAPPIIVQTIVSENVHARIDHLKQQIRQIKMSNSSVTWDVFYGIPMTNLPTKFRMPKIKRYIRVGCPCIHLKLYSAVMRAPWIG